MNVLVTGGAGYIGNVLVPELLGNGYSVRVLDYTLYRNNLIPKKEVEFIRGDINDANLLSEALKGIDAVIHLAAIVGDPVCDLNKEGATKTNFLATKHLAESCAKESIKLIFASTCSVYGSQPDALITEDSAIMPLTIYALSKLAAEEAILKLSGGEFKPTIFRMGTVHGYSPRMKFDLVANTFAAAAIQEKKITVFGGQQWRPLLHIRDIPRFYLSALRSNSGGVFNIGGKNYRIMDLANIVASSISCDVETYVEMVDKRDYKVSSEKAFGEFGIGFDYGVENTVEEIKLAYDKGLIKNYKDKKFRHEPFLERKR